MRLGIFLTLLGLVLNLAACSHATVREVCLPNASSGLWDCSDSEGNDTQRVTREMAGKFGAFPLDDIHQCFHLMKK